MTSMFSITTASIGDVAGFLKALLNGDVVNSADGLIDLLEEHHKWEAEYGAWQANGKPTSASDAGWDAFLTAVNAEPVDTPEETPDAETPPAAPAEAPAVEEPPAGAYDSGHGGMTVVTIPGQDGAADVTVSADVAQLKHMYGAELANDGKAEASPEEIVKHIYEQNPEAHGLEVNVTA